MSERIRVPLPSAGLKQPDGVASSIERIGNQNDLMVSQLHGSLHEAAVRESLFGASSQAATTTTIALATTYTGLCLSNPAGNTKNLALRQVGIAFSVAPAGIAPVALAGGYSAAGIAVHTTPLVTYPMNLGGSVAASGLADAACTLVAGAGAGLLRVIMPLQSGQANGTFPFSGVQVYDVQGAIILKPGAFVFVYTLTVGVGLFAFTWEEYTA